MRVILMRAALPNAQADIVLVRLTHNDITPYVTWQMNTDTEDTYWGHYHRTYEEAVTEFKKRCERLNATLYMVHEYEEGKGQSQA